MRAVPVNKKNRYTTLYNVSLWLLFAAKTLIWHKKRYFEKKDVYFVTWDSRTMCDTFHLHVTYQLIRPEQCFTLTKMKPDKALTKTVCLYHIEPVPMWDSNTVRLWSLRGSANVRQTHSQTVVLVRFSPHVRLTQNQTVVLVRFSPHVRLTHNQTVVLVRFWQCKTSTLSDCGPREVLSM